MKTADAAAPQAVPGPQDRVILAVDTHEKERAYFLCSGSDLHGPNGAGTRINAHALEGLEGGGRVFVVVYPTRTYSEGMGAALFSELSPEDRAFLRAVRRRFPDAVCVKVSLHHTAMFEKLTGYLDGEGERTRHRREQESAAARAADPAGHDRRGAFAFDPEYLRNAKALFQSSMTRPNRQDFSYLAYKTFGLNLAVRLGFMIASVRRGELPLVRAVISTTWYQLQDAVFTVFGQTYMKFLGKMTGMVRVFGADMGDLFFVYFQLCGFEFLNRLVLGPLGENPLVYTWSGLGLIFLNILQGMLSGGPLIPAINQMRKVGAISHNTMMHFYQLSSLTMQFGLFASFGYQFFYTVLTSAVLVLSWSSYFVFSTMYKDPEFLRLEGKDVLGKMDALALRCAGARA